MYDILETLFVTYKMQPLKRPKYKQNPQLFLAPPKPPPLLGLLSLLLGPVALLGRHKLGLALLCLFDLAHLLLLEALGARGLLLGLLAEKVLAALNLAVDLALLGRGRERRVRLLGLVGDAVRRAALAERLAPEVGQEAIPALVLELRVLGELALDHELLDVVDGVDVGHAVLDDAPHLLEALVGPHDGHGVAVHENVRLGQQLERLEGRAVRAEDALAALDEAVLVADEVADLDDVARDAVVEDLDGLRRGHAAGQQLDEVAGVEDGGRVKGLAGRLDHHRALDQIQGAGDAVAFERLGNQRPGLLQVHFAVLGKQRHEGRLLSKGAAGIVLGFELLNLPLVNIVCIPGFFLFVCGRHDVRCVGVCRFCRFVVENSATAWSCEGGKRLTFLPPGKKAVNMFFSGAPLLVGTPQSGT